MSIEFPSHLAPNLPKLLPKSHSLVNTGRDRMKKVSGSIKNHAVSFVDSQIHEYQIEKPAVFHGTIPASQEVRLALNEKGFKEAVAKFLEIQAQAGNPRIPTFVKAMATITWSQIYADAKRRERSDSDLNHKLSYLEIACILNPLMWSWGDDPWGTEDTRQPIADHTVTAISTKLDSDGLDAHHRGSGHSGNIGHRAPGDTEDTEGFWGGKESKYHALVSKDDIKAEIDMWFENPDVNDVKLEPVKGKIAKNTHVRESAEARNRSEKVLSKDNLQNLTDAEIKELEAYIEGKKEERNQQQSNTSMW